jgi:iron complex transport system substrate-binding protein
VGRTESCDRPANIANVAIVVRSTKPDYEAILGLEPDLIMYDKSLYSDDEIAKIKDLKIETLVYDPKTIGDYAEFNHVLASKLSLETQVSKQMDSVYDAIETAKGHPTTNPKTTILLGDGQSYDYLVLGKESFHAHILQECGATVVGADGRPFQNLNVERLIDMDPDVIYSDGNAQSIYGDPRLQSLSAVKGMHVYDVDSKTIVRIGDQLRALIERFDDDLHRLPVNRPQVAAR